MSPPKPKINTFLQRTSKPVVEPVSKVFIIAGLILGVNRLPLIGITNIACIIICLCISLILLCVILFFYVVMQWNPKSFLWLSVIIVDYLQYFLCAILGFMLHKRLLNFYLNLNKFDDEIGINVTKFGIRATVYNFLQLIVTLLLSVTLYCIGIKYGHFVNLTPIIPIKMFNCFELHFYGHLLSLMIPRLKCIIHCMACSRPNIKSRETSTNSPNNEFGKNDIKPHLHNQKLMDFYNDIIIAYDCLNEAIKWQMLIYLISTFSITLLSLYNLIKIIISGDNTNTRGMILLSLSLMVVQLCPLLIPCVFVDLVQREVLLIKDFLACKLYENTFDKQSRSTARTLLALIETRNLSFSLFHMFHVDMALPFKFLALLLTYLIILLQFDKVISP